MLRGIILLFFGSFLFSCSKNTIESKPQVAKVLPIAPSNLKATSLSITEINLTWIDNSTNEDGFKIERKDGTSEFKVIATIGIDKTEYKDSLLTPYIQYVYRAFAFNTLGKSLTYTNTDSAATYGVPVVTTKQIDSLTSTDGLSGGIITNNGGYPILKCGIIWSISNTPLLELTNKPSDFKGNNNFNSFLFGLSPGTTYYLWAYATNTLGTSFGNMVVFKTKDFVFQEVKSTTGRIWMDRNLGAGQVATSVTDQKSYGYRYQWGRGNDGHQLAGSATTNVLSASDQPGNSSFIIGNFDWRTTVNDQLWQGTAGVNNVCPIGFRIPTIKEWQDEIKTWPINNSEAAAFASALKLPFSGYRDGNMGNLNLIDIYGYYWSSSPVFANPAAYSIIVREYGTGRDDVSYTKSMGQSVRCIKN
jgi:uncharacterized protein (TIGR02145 family)